MTVIVRPATERDFLQLRSSIPPLRCRAWAGELDGVVIAIGGVAFGLFEQAAGTVFLEGADAASRYPVALHKAARLVLRTVSRDLGLRTLAMAVDVSKPRAEAWARRLGFEPIGDSGVWLWRTSE